MRFHHTLPFILALLIAFGAPNKADARRKRHRGRRHHRYTGPPPTHPVVLWARTLSESTDPEQRKIAAFKLSTYSQPLYQEAVINTLIRCMGDADVQIKVLCTKAMGHAGTQSVSDTVRDVLLERYKADPILRSTIVRVFITRGDSSMPVQDTFLDAAKQSPSQEELLTLLGYFEAFGSGSDKFVQSLVQIYNSNDKPMIRRAVVKALGERGRGQDAVIALLSQCADNKDTPLALTCLSGLQLQAKKDTRAWSAVEKTIQSEDPDVLMATLDVINALPETPNPKIAKRLVEITEEIDDSELQEKAVLALGNCGDKTETIVNTLVKLLRDQNTDESTRIAAALVMGKQSSAFPDLARAELAQCSTTGSSQPMRMACQLGIKEFEARKGTVHPAPAIAASPVPVKPAATTPAVAPVPAPAPLAEKSEKTDKGDKSEKTDKVDSGDKNEKPDSAGEKPAVKADAPAAGKAEKASTPADAESRQPKSERAVNSTPESDTQSVSKEPIGEPGKDTDQD